MQLKDLENIPISNVKVKLPTFWYLSVTQFGDNVNEKVWLVGPMMGDWFVKNNHEDTQIYPLFTDSISWSDLRDWEVIEIKE